MATMTSRPTVQIALDNSEIRTVLRTLADELSGPASLRESEENEGRPNLALWNELARGGWLELARSPDTDWSAANLQLALIELGRAGAAVPYRSTVGVLGLLLAAGELDGPGSDELLTKIGAGEIWIPVAWHGGPEEEFHHGVLDGVRRLVPDASGHVMGYVVAVAAAHKDDVSWLTVETGSGGLSHTQLANTAREPLANLMFDAVPANFLATTRRDRTVPAFTACRRLASASWLVGLCWRVLDMSVEHVAQREQFGRPIGSFQAVQHKLADVVIALQGVTDLARAAALAITRHGMGHKDSLILATEAFLAAQACGRLTSTNAHQVWGGAGVSTEYDLQLFTRRIQSSIHLGDDPDDMRAEVLDARYAETKAH